MLRPAAGNRAVPTHEPAALLLGTLRVRRRQTDSVQRLVKRSFRSRCPERDPLPPDGGTAAAIGNDTAAGIRSCIAWKKMRSITSRLAPPMPSTVMPLLRVRATLDGQIVRMAQNQRIPMVAAISEVIFQSRCAGHRRIRSRSSPSTRLRPE